MYNAFPVCFLFLSTFKQHTHRIVICAVFDCVVRHARLLTTVNIGGRNGVVIVLDAVLGETGIASVDARVRQRAASTFARLAKYLRSELLGYSDALLQACAPSMTIAIGDHERRLSFADQLCLYEAMGSVLGQSSSSAASVAAVFRALLDGLTRLAGF